MRTLAITYWTSLHGHLRAAWLLVFAILAVDIAWIASTDVGFAERSLVSVALLAAASLYASARVLKPGYVKTLADGYVFLSIGWPSLRLFNHLTFTQSGDYVDAGLSHADRALGFPWFEYASWIDHNPLAITLLDLSYSSLTHVSIATFIALTLFSRRNAAEEFLLLFASMAVFVSAMVVVTPAVGTMAYYAGEAAQLKNLADVGLYHIPYYENLRSNPAPLLQLEHLPGLSTFPSFHTAMGILLVYCARERLILLVPAIVYSALMIAATPVFGSHYLVDVIAGAAMTFVAVALMRLWQSRAGGSRRGQVSLPTPAALPGE